MLVQAQDPVLIVESGLYPEYFIFFPCDTTRV